MAARKTAEVTETKPARTRKPKSLKIERKKKPTAKKAPRARLAIKQAKLDRVLRKARTIVCRALKKAVRGMDLKRIPDKLYKKIDTAVSKNTELTSIVEAAVVKAVNDLPALKNGNTTTKTTKTAATEKPKKRRTRKAKEVAGGTEPAAPAARKTKEAAAEPAAATTNGKKNGNGKKKDAEPAATEA